MSVHASAPESFAEQLVRVELMTQDATGETWDLSDNDRAALAAVLDSARKLARVSVDWLGTAAAQEMDRLAANRDELRSALKDVVDIIDAAGLLNLSNGVQLGPTVWYAKAYERVETARRALATAAEGAQ